MKTTALLIYSIIFVGFIGQAEEGGYAADNTGINTRDKSVVEMTAQDQSNEPNDVALLRQIRMDLTKDKDLSTYAKNVKIIVSKNTVILKGPVKSQTEITKIVKFAATAAPTHKILNELQVTK
ncbi:MAG: BON domain-containing protein [Bdellovibrio sp.]|nr:BON domain-containing protein [Bdellovibrio sp.]